MQTATFMMKVKVFFTKKKIIWTVIILLVLLGGWFIFGRGSSSSTIQTSLVKKQDIQKTVLTTGQVVSSTNLDLSFQTSGVVRKINVIEGDIVKVGQTLAVLDQGIVSANLQNARATLAQAQANYEKIKSAATPQDIAVSQAAFDSASIALTNATQNLLNELSVAYNNANTVVFSNTNNLFLNPGSANPQFSVPGIVIADQQLMIGINIERTGINSMLASWQNEISTLNQSNVDKTTSDSLANLSSVSKYLSDIINILTNTQFATSANSATITAATAPVVSGKATIDATYTTLTNYGQSVNSAKASLAQAQASLSLKQAPARQEDVDIAAAQVLSAQSGVDSAQVAMNNTVLSAPASGTITQVDVKLGEQAVAMKEIMILQNVGDLHAEALVSESDIASVAVGQSIDNTFDALGPDQHFTTTVLSVNPASTVVSGVVNYKVVGSLEKIPEVKPGMTDNMTIMVAEKKDVLAVPSSAIVNKNGGRFIKVIDDTKKKTYHEVSVQTGLEADGGLTEIISGLSVGQEIITYIK
jgi:RND family efflux transporter MFP subunit